VDILLHSIAQLKAAGLPLVCSIVGEGPYIQHLKTLQGELDLRAEVTFQGALPFDQVLDVYENADILVLASLGDSWGKVVTEAMSFGLICIGSNRDVVAQNLANGRGLVVPARDVDALSAALWQVAAMSPGARQQMSAAAAAWGQRYSLENLREQLAELLANWWSLDTRHRSRSKQPAMTASKLLEPTSR
jgi:glycosyltransferase involved in cell wall biosynthesis